MKKLILLAVCAAALFAAVPSSAVCVSSLPTGGFACAEPYGAYEACAWGYSDFTTIWTDNCVDANGSEYYDFYVSGYGPQYNYDIYRSDLNLGASTKAGPRCTWVWVQPDLGNPVGGGTTVC